MDIILINFFKAKLASLREKTVGWFFRFQNSHRTEKIQMVKLPAAFFLAIIILFNFGPMLAPPGISYVYPAKNDKEVPLDTAIEMIFDKEVIKDSVARNFKITPETEGKMVWEGNQKLIFTPNAKLQRGTKYKISFSGPVFSTKLVPFIGNADVKFETIGQPKVVVHSPGVEALEDLSPMMVIFDRPMIPLTTATNSAERKPAFNVLPEIEGEGRWLGTTAYQFRPGIKYKKATTYKVTVPSGIKSQDGGVLDSDYVFEFSSEKPRVMAISPENGFKYASPVASVSAIFNQNMNSELLAEKFRVYDANKNEIPGRVVVNGKTAGFYAYQPLIREQKYNAVVLKGAQGIEGPNGMEDDYGWPFTVAPFPKILSTNPANSAIDVTDQHVVTVDFNTIMDEESFENNITINPKPDIKPSYYFSAYSGYNRLNINTYFGRSTEYSVTIGPGVKDVYGVAVGTPYTFKFTTAPYLPSISINPSGTYFAAFNQSVVPRIVVNVTNSKTVNYTLYKLKKDDFIELYRRRYDNWCNGNSDPGCYNWQSFNPARLEKLRSWSENFDSEFNTPVTVVTKVVNGDGSLIPSGLYFIEAGIPQGAKDNLVMIVSRSTVTVKKSEKQIFAWVVDQSTGNVVPKAAITLTDNNGAVIAEGTTNSDGVFVKDVDLFQKNNLMVFGQKDDDFFTASSQWSNGIDRYEFGLPSYYSENEQKDYNARQDYKIFVTLDRPIYRPGQKIYFKGVVRKDNDGAYEKLLPGTQITVEINDAQGKSIYKKDIPINSFGSYSGDFSLSADSSVGNFQLRSNFSGNTFVQNFQVEEYRKPDVSVKVIPAKTAYVNGENTELNINASYYFGAPVVDAPVVWTVSTQDYNFKWDKDYRFEFGDPESYWMMYWYNNPGGSQKKVTDGDGVTDAKGDLKVAFPLNISNEKSSQKMTMEATVNDKNNQSIASSTEYTVHKSGRYIGLKPFSYGNESGKEAKVDVVTVDLKGNELTGINVDLEFFKRTWDTVKEQDPDNGFFYYKSVAKDSSAGTSSVVTDDFGRATAVFIPETGGTYRVVARVKDQNGNVNLSSTFLWVSGYGFSAEQENNDRILLATDKKEYLVGENMSLFIATPFATDSAKTIVTFERGKVLGYKIFDTSDVSNNFKLDITPNLVPNTYVGAVLVRAGNKIKKPAEFKIGYAEIKVTDKKKQINVIITTDKKRYRPRDKMTLNIETKDMLGNPVAAELALGVVDKAVWDLARSNLSDIYKLFYQPRNLEVDTSQLLTISMDRINANINLGAKGGSGGGGGGGFDTTRREFPDTAYWNPHLKTDGNGKASLQVKLPDSLTTWRINAIANSEESAFGSNLSEVIVSRDVLIRPFMPRFLAIGDESKLGVIIANTMPEPQNLKVKIETEGIIVNDEIIKTVDIPENQQAKVTWNTTAGTKEKAKITVSVYGSDGSLKDSMETTLPVKRFDIPETVATSGEVKSTITENIKLPEELVKDRGEVTISVSPSLGSAGFSSIAFLDSYPYYCLEQTTSKFLPAVYLHQIFTQAGITKQGSIDISNLESVVNDGIQRLTKAQKVDGGWGWWIEYDSDPYLSAYAYLGLFEASKAKFTVDKQVLKNAENFLIKQLSSSNKWISLDTKVFILYSLIGNSNLSSYTANLYQRRFELSIENRARLSAVLKSAGMESAGKKLLDELLSMVKKTNTASHWEEPKNRYYYFGSNISATAAMLETMVLYNTNNPLIPETVRYILTTRQDNHWGSTKDTAMVLKALTKQILVKGDQKVNETYNILFSGKVFKNGQFTKEDLFKMQEYIIDINNIPLGVDNKLVFEKSGDGNLYYNINMKYFLPYSEIKPLEQGIVVVRDFIDVAGKTLQKNEVKENTEIWERLTIVAPEERHYVVIEDILPAGLESVNESLKNVSTLNKEKPKNTKGTSRAYLGHQEFRDDRTVFFADYLPAGIYEITYRLRATTPGKYHYPPASAYEMYLPDVMGHSDGGWLVVTGD